MFLVRWRHAIYQHTLNGKISTYYMFIHQNLMSTYHKWSTHQVYLDVSIPFIKIFCMIRCEHIIIYCMSTYHVLVRCQHTIYQHTLNGNMLTYHIFIHQNSMSTYHEWSTSQFYFDISISFIKKSCMIRCEHNVIPWWMSTYHV